MRNVINPQLQLGQVNIGEIEIDVTSRDDIPMILLGLQHIYTNDPLREAVFGILTDVIPCKASNGDGDLTAVDADKGRPRMGQWTILVLGTLRLALNAVQELANQHRTLRLMLGHGMFDTGLEYRLQTLKNNLRLFTPEIM